MPEAVARNLARRGFSSMSRRSQALEEQRKHWAVEVDRLRAERNANAKAVGAGQGRGEDIARADGAGRGPQRTQLTRPMDSSAAVQAELERWQLELPNLLHESVPDGS